MHTHKALPSEKVLAKNYDKVGRFVPTGLTLVDIMSGENHRDPQGNITDVRRGMEVGKQYAICALQGAGKSTMVGQMSAFPMHVGMIDCIYKVIIVNSDNSAWDNQRIRKLTNLPLSVIEEKYEVLEMCRIEEITDSLEKMSKEYNKAKLKPVEYMEPYMGVKKKMMPVVLVYFDTVTSITSKMAEKDTIGKAQNLGTFLDVSNLATSITDFFSGNIIPVWVTHLKENVPKPGQTVAAKEFKSAPGKWKSHLPQRIKQKASCIFWMTKIQDMENQESPNHPIQKYGLNDLKSKSIYETSLITVKSRSGVEGRTVAKLVYIDGTFDPFMHVLASCLQLGVLKEASGNYPSATYPSVFKDKTGCDNEQLAMGRRMKRALKIPGYDRPTSIIELRLLLNYGMDKGPNDEINEDVLYAQSQVRVALMNALEDTLYYELESNNVTEEELNVNSARIHSLLGFISCTKMERKEITKKSVDESKPELDATAKEAI